MGLSGAATPAFAAGSRHVAPPPAPAVIVRPGDIQYAALASRGYNTRFVATPDEIWLVHSADQVKKAVDQAVGKKQRITVRSGGHCFEDLVDNPDFRLLVDTKEMNRVYFDPDMNAFAVESGATLGQVYAALYQGWGVVLPGGVCPEVGAGGHVAGGGYGPLSRRFGLSVDHLYAVEVVVPGCEGDARVVVATRRPDDPNHDLWWAHTGGGGGNFGIVTKYWFRTPGATGTDPSGLLPKPPARVLKTMVTWQWSELTEANFTRLVMNHGAWHAANSSADSPYAMMHSSFQLFSSMATIVQLDITMDNTLPNTKSLLDAYIAALSAGVSATPKVDSQDLAWLDFALTPSVTYANWTRHKSMGGYMRKPFTQTQVSALYRSLTDPTHTGGGLVYLAAYGGKINTVGSADTAMAQRDSILKIWYASNWPDAARDQSEVDWIRGVREGVHASTGGYPVPNDQQDGLYINYPDVDSRDPKYNTSGVPWSTLYYKDNYPRLQRVKRAYDPRNVFRNPLSIDPA
ncbi:FAD-binding oxidoreductase [Kitasatospora sp. NPDC096128]|uniref:FAD-binding oxidoreductase n=1 Tax=Kitasatospora sp. NPDC096128 TaxID=3155547 RepID=UPI00331A5DC8